jgi:glutamine phosphoribosylpyrophosphate amidotransferase
MITGVWIGNRGRRIPPRACGIVGIFRHEGNTSAELYEALLMLQHRGQDSAGMVTTDGSKYHEHKANGLVSEAFANQKLMDKLIGTLPLICTLAAGCACGFWGWGGEGK